MEIRITIEDDLKQKKERSFLTWKALIRLGFEALEERKRFTEKLNAQNDEIEHLRDRIQRLAGLLNEECRRREDFYARKKL